MYRFFKTVDDQFIIKIIRGEAGPEEKEYFQKWLDQSDSNKEKYANLLLIWQKADDFQIPRVPDPNDQFERIFDAIHSGESRSEDKTVLSRETLSAAILPRAGQYRVSWFIRWSPALALGVVLAVSTLIYRLPGSYIPDKTPAQTALYESSQTPVEFCEISTRRGQRAQVTLPDGSQVFLNADSRLKFPKTFQSRERIVEFCGEGFFKIAKLNNMPFKVMTGKTVTEVVGTEFNIKSRSRDKYNLVVVEGIVKTYDTSNSKPIVLTKGEMLSYSTGSGFTKPSAVNADNYTAWRNNRLVFDNTPLAEVMNELNLTFDTDCRLQNALLGNKFLTGTFTTRSIDEILKAISLSLDIKVIKEKNRIILQ